METDWCRRGRGSVRRSRPRDGVLTEIDVQATLRDKLGVDTEPDLILGACNPSLARQALNADRRIGLLLPYDVVVRTEAS